jgi:hypothetical protein
MNLDESIERLEARIRMENNSDYVPAQCEECGVDIPVEHTLCLDCEAR